MQATITNHIYFNQINLQDIKDGGNCFAYTVLFFNFIFLMRLKQPDLPIDYANLIQLFNAYPGPKRHALNELQREYKTEPCILNAEIALLHDNDSFLTDGSLLSICKLIRRTSSHFNEPKFYFFSFVDRRQKLLGHILAHSVGLYLAAPNEIHYFNSVGGLYILKLPENYTAEDLEKDLVELTFKKNVLFSWLFTEKSPTLKFTLTVSTEKVSLNSDEMYLFNLLQKAVHKEKITTTDLSLFTSNPEIKQKFILRLLEIIQLIQHEKTYRFHTLVQSIHSLFNKMSTKLPPS